MNLGQAVALCLYELVRDSRTARQPEVDRFAVTHEKEKPATASDLERITALLLNALRSSGYLPPRPAPSAEEKIRRLVPRLRLPARDVALWLSILRQIVWKTRPGK